MSNSWLEASGRVGRNGPVGTNIHGFGVPWLFLTASLESQDKQRQHTPRTCARSSGSVLCVDAGTED